MENTIRKFSIAGAIHGMNIVTFVMLFGICSMIFFSHNMFLDVLPVTMPQWERDVATWLMALGWEWTVLVMTCNPKYIHTVMPKIAALASALIVLFFVQAFDFSQPLIVLSQRWLMGSMAGTNNLIFARLFHEKWLDLNYTASLPDEVTDLENRVTDLESRLTHSESALLLCQAREQDLQSEVSQRDSLIKKLQSELSEHAQDVTCPWCNRPHKTRQSLLSHKRHCEKNPTKLTKA